MSKNIKQLTAIIVLIIMILSGCANRDKSTSETPKGDATVVTEDTKKAKGDTASVVADSEKDKKDTVAVVEDTDRDNSDASTVGDSATPEIVVDTEFSKRDLEVGYEESTATRISLSDTNVEVTGEGAITELGVITISQEGTYVISGTIKDGRVIIDAGDSDKIHLVLKDASITCSNYAPVYIKNADKVFITLEEGTVNSLIDGYKYVQVDENDVDGAIFSKADLTINGKGTLNITGNYKHGILSKDDLVITGGTYLISAVKDALNGKDCVKIKDGVFTLSSEKGNAIQSRNNDDITKGYVYIGGGSITVTKCREDIESEVISITDEVIYITP
ncbi:MAG TPA: carbohydrate-binding domain-containing protein [Mobilitalea sp.]|nr:carbohydrate-binding domain-containing protein [Mobilitalea sp.]